MNLDSLRRRRVRRLGVKATAHTGQKHIFSILDRATRKFHGDVGLWMQYAEYARSQKSNKKFARILTDVLRMHPTKPELWIYAARYALDVQADTAAARGYMKRGIRFCKNSRLMYLEFAKLEMTYIATRRRIVGLDERSARSKVPEPEVKGDIVEADMITLPTAEPEDVNVDLERALEVLASTPAMNGAIPIAIFDEAMKQFSDDTILGERFFNLFADFAQVSCTPRILDHVLNHLVASNSSSASTRSCSCRRPLIGVPVDSADFLAVLRSVLKNIKIAMVESAAEKTQLAEKICAWLSPLGEATGVAPEVRIVISATLKQLLKETKT